jgi:hypothetical protein
MQLVLPFLRVTVAWPNITFAAQALQDLLVEAQAPSACYPQFSRIFREFCRYVHLPVAMAERLTLPLRNALVHYDYSHALAHWLGRFSALATIPICEHTAYCHALWAEYPVPGSVGRDDLHYMLCMGSR